MDWARIRHLLKPFTAAPLADLELSQISIYIDLLLRWNTRINLTAVRHEDSIVTRHFGESLFAAQHLFPAGGDSRTPGAYVDLGSGAGFPGLPIKIAQPRLRLTLIESNHKKATFLREVIRALGIVDATVFAARGEGYPAAATSLVTLRAVERFDQALSLAARLVAQRGRLALLIGSAQLDRVHRLTPGFDWQNPIPVPLSDSGILVVAGKSEEP